MKNKRLHFLVGIAAICLSLKTIDLTAQTNSKNEIPKGFSVSPNGLLYKNIRKNKDAKVPVKDDIVSIRARYYMQIGNVDSLLFDSKVNPAGFISIQVGKPEYKGDLIEGISMMHLGDSTTFLVPADSFFLKTVHLETLPPFCTPGQKIRFEIGLAEISTLDEMKKKQAVLDSISQVNMQTQREKEMGLLIAKMQANGDNIAPEPSGLIIIRRTPGNGVKPIVGQTVTVHYTGKLLDGTVFDSSIERKEPISFPLGNGSVIKGWDEGIAALEIGSKATLMIPSWLGYGPRNMGSIPSNSSLIFEVELIKAE